MARAARSAEVSALCGARLFAAAMIADDAAYSSRGARVISIIAIAFYRDMPPAHARAAYGAA